MDVFNHPIQWQTLLYTAVIDCLPTQHYTPADIHLSKVLLNYQASRQTCMLQSASCASVSLTNGFQQQLPSNQSETNNPLENRTIQETTVKKGGVPKCYYVPSLGSGHKSVSTSEAHDIFNTIVLVDTRVEQTSALPRTWQNQKKKKKKKENSRSPS